MTPVEKVSRRPYQTIPSNNLASEIKIKELPNFLHSKVKSLSPYDQINFTSTEKEKVLKRITPQLKGIDMYWGDELTLEKYLNKDKLKGVNLAFRFYFCSTTERIFTIRFRLEPMITIKDFGAFEVDFGEREKLKER